MNGRDDKRIKKGMRIESRDYGAGTVVALLPTGVQVWWDENIIKDEVVSKDEESHLTIHDAHWILEQRRLVE